MTKDKIKRVLKRLPYILQMIKEGKTEANFYISKSTERIVIDEEVKAVVEIIEEIISLEQEEWIKDIFRKVKEGDKDVYIMMDSPVGRGKYYLTKEHFVNKIYDCCIYRGLVSYEDILSEQIG